MVEVIFHSNPCPVCGEKHINFPGIPSECKESDYEVDAYDDLGARSSKRRMQEKIRLNKLKKKGNNNEKME